jgi:hypothetical protein
MIEEQTSDFHTRTVPENLQVIGMHEFNVLAHLLLRDLASGARASRKESGPQID